MSRGQAKGRLWAQMEENEAAAEEEAAHRISWTPEESFSAGKRHRCMPKYTDARMETGETRAPNCTPHVACPCPDALTDEDAMMVWGRLGGRACAAWGGKERG